MHRITELRWVSGEGGGGRVERRSSSAAGFTFTITVMMQSSPTVIPPSRSVISHGYAGVTTPAYQTAAAADARLANSRASPPQPLPPTRTAGKTEEMRGAACRMAKVEL